MDSIISVSCKTMLTTKMFQAKHDSMFCGSKNTNEIDTTAPATLTTDTAPPGLEIDIYYCFRSIHLRLMKLENMLVLQNYLNRWITDINVINLIIQYAHENMFQTHATK